MSVVFSYHDIPTCDLKWWSLTTTISVAGAYNLIWTCDRPGQPIAFSVGQRDGLPVTCTISHNGTNIVQGMQIDSSMIVSTANLPQLARNEQLNISGSGTGGQQLTFSILMKLNNPTTE